MDEFGIDLTDINFITMFGGEPLIMKQHSQLIDFIANSNNIHDKILQYYTNGTMLPDKKTISVWGRVKKLQLFISVDGYGVVNDYFRHGSKWDTIESNIKSFINYSNKYNWELRISTLISIYNVDRLDILHNWLVNQGINVDKINYNLCIIPQELDIRNLPKEYKDEILEIYKTINLPTQLINMVTNHINTEPNIDFIASAAFSDKLDEMRNEDNPNPLLKVHMNGC
jgi:sulfatase maturation enzyme AslB (radical SAM superfamily)